MFTKLPLPQMGLESVFMAASSSSQVGSFGIRPRSVNYGRFKGFRETKDSKDLRHDASQPTQTVRLNTRQARYEVFVASDKKTLYPHYSIQRHI